MNPERRLFDTLIDAVEAISLTDDDGDHPGFTCARDGSMANAPALEDVLEDDLAFEWRRSRNRPGAALKDEGIEAFRVDLTLRVRLKATVGLDAEIRGLHVCAVVSLALVRGDLQGIDQIFTPDEGDFRLLESDGEGESFHILEADFGIVYLRGSV